MRLRPTFCQPETAMLKRKTQCLFPGGIGGDFCYNGPVNRFRTFWANESRRKDMLAAVGFLTPNLIGFACFVAFPVLFSAAMAFTNWNLTHSEPLRFTGLENFRELFTEDTQFWRYLVNTLYLMLGLPVAIAGSLLLAILLAKPINIANRRTHRRLALAALLAAGIGAAMLWQAGRYDLALLTLLAAFIIVGGLVLQVVFFRTLFYLPCFTSGVAMFVLWKSLLHPDWGLINRALGLGYGGLQTVAKYAPSTVLHGLAAVAWLLAALLLIRLARRCLASLKTVGYLPQGTGASILVFGVLIAAAGFVWRWPELSASNFEPIRWLSSTDNLLAINPEHLGLDARFWGLGARDAIIIMGLWAAIGGNNMLLYLAGLANVPSHLYEAAQIDGAGRWAQFRHVIWPQLAPTTFFIVIMSTIGGLQGGFEQAYIMTRGGPAGTTTTLGYYIYNIGFEEFRLGYASTVAWVMFAMIFALTLINWRFGSRFVNE